MGSYSEVYIMPYYEFIPSIDLLRAIKLCYCDLGIGLVHLCLCPNVYPSIWSDSSETACRNFFKLYITSCPGMMPIVSKFWYCLSWHFNRQKKYLSNNMPKYWYQQHFFAATTYSLLVIEDNLFYSLMCKEEIMIMYRPALSLATMDNLCFDQGRMFPPTHLPPCIVYINYHVLMFLLRC